MKHDRCSWVFKVTQDMKQSSQEAKPPAPDYNKIAKLCHMSYLKGRCLQNKHTVVYCFFVVTCMLFCLLLCVCVVCVVCVCVEVSHPAAPWSGTFRHSKSGCCRLPPRSFTWLMLLGRKGRVVLLDEGCLCLWCCEFLWLATWLAFFRPPFWWATAEEEIWIGYAGSTSMNRRQAAVILWDVNAVPGGPGAARDGMLWWVLDVLGRPWVKLFLVGPE